MRDGNLEATWRLRRGSAAAKPRWRREDPRKREAGTEEREDRMREVEEEVVGMREREVGDAAEAIVLH